MATIVGYVATLLQSRKLCLMESRRTIGDPKKLFITISFPTESSDVLIFIIHLGCTVVYDLFNVNCFLYFSND